MKRDMNLVRAILIAAEEANDNVSSDHIANANDIDESIVAQHMELMEQAGLVKVISSIDLSRKRFAEIDSITWRGYDFLANIRSETAWKKIRKTVVETLGDASLPVISALAEKLAIQSLEGVIGK